MITYEEAAKLPSSEKITLVTCEAVELVKLFDLYSGSIYSKSVDHFVVNVKVSGISLNNALSESLLENEFYFDPTIKKLYVRLAGGVNPKNTDICIVYKFFFSDTPVILPYDFNLGNYVQFEPRVISIGSLGQQLDDENTGIVLESSSSVNFENTDGYFDLIFDSLIWENQNVNFYSWLPVTPINQTRKLFEGVIEAKDFSPLKVSFKVKDFVFRLKNKLNLGVFSEIDGKFEPSMLSKPKRRIYGQVNQLRCQGLDKVLDGFTLDGNVSALIDSVILNGTGTFFLDQVSPGDELFISLEKSIFKVGVESIESNTSLTISKKTEIEILNRPLNIRPSISYRKKNRLWHIAGHKLRQPTTSIVEVVAPNRVRVDSVQDLFAGDSVKINSEFVQIRRISGDVLILQSVLLPAPIIGDTVQKNPVSKVFFGSKELIIDRDFSIINLGNSKIELNDLAEFNITEQRGVGSLFSFVNGSRLITTSASVDLRSIIKPRDWIRKDLVTETSWYEVLDVKEQEITIRTPFAGTNSSNNALMKNVSIVEDDSLITVNCLGIEVDNNWVRTPSQAVRHLILNDAEFDSVNEQSFDKANSSCSFTLSIYLPESLGSESPLVRDVITKINESVFGSLYGNSSWDISYSILNSQKPESFNSIRDEDILSFDVVTDQSIINQIKVNYSPYTDIFTGLDGFESYSETSVFVNNFIGVKKSTERTIYLFEDDKAKIIAQRILMFKSLSNSKVRVKSKMNLALTSVNDKLFLELDRLYLRYGGRDRRKIGIVTSVKKNGYESDIEFTDVGNIFNRIPSISPNTAVIYDLAGRDDVVQFGYILDNQTSTPNPESETDLGNNLIG